MFGCSIKARACLSASNLATTDRVSIPSLITFEGYLPPHPFFLLSEINHPVAALADAFDQPIMANPLSEASPRQGSGRIESEWSWEKPSRARIRLKQRFDPRAQECRSRHKRNPETRSGLPDQRFRPPRRRRHAN
jgi:hypothetical protein